MVYERLLNYFMVVFTSEVQCVVENFLIMKSMQEKTMGNVELRSIDTNALVIEGGTPRLMGGKCPTCGKLFFPYREFCTDCFTEGKVERMPLDQYGTLISYTVVRRAPGREVPFAAGYVEMANGLVLFGLLKECDVEHLSVGTKWETVFFNQTDRLDREVVAYGFRPVKETGNGE